MQLTLPPFSRNAYYSVVSEIIARASRGGGAFERTMDGPDANDMVTMKGTSDGSTWSVTIDGPTSDDMVTANGTVSDARWTARVDGPGSSDLFEFTGTVSGNRWETTVDGPGGNDIVRQSGTLSRPPIPGMRPAEIEMGAGLQQAFLGTYRLMGL